MWALWWRGCQEIGVAAPLDDVLGLRLEQVSVGTAMVALILNGLGSSSYCLLQVSQFLATKAIEHAAEPDITAGRLCGVSLGRAFDRLSTCEPVRCANLAGQGASALGAGPA